MKFPIRFKIVALGLLISVVATSVGVVVNTLNYRNKAVDAMYTQIKASLEDCRINISHQTDELNYIDAIKATKEYIQTQYEANPYDPVFETFEEQYNYYKAKYPYVYGPTGAGLSLDMLIFQNKYKLIISLLEDSMITSSGVNCYLAYMDDARSRIVYLGDYRSDGRITEGCILPGSYASSFPSYLTKEGDYYRYEVPSTNEHAFALMIHSNVDSTIFGYIFIKYDFTKIDEDVNRTLLTTILTLSLTMLGLIILFAILSHFYIVRHVKKLNDTTLEFSNSLDNLEDIKVLDPKIKSRDEIGELSASFVKVESSLIKYIDALQKETHEKEMINAELSVASTIQLEALPSRSFDDDNIGLKASITTAKEVGGDFYDYFYLDDNRFAFLIADVSGKGVPAALFMMKAKELIKFELSQNDSLEQVASYVNEALLIHNKEGLFVTAFIAVLDIKNNKLKYVNAGHERPFLIKDNEVTQLNIKNNFILGGVNGFKYVEEEIDFDVDTRLFLFTDGLNESINSKREEFGYQNIERVLKENASQSNREILRIMSEELNKHTNNVEGFDDVTMMMFRSKDPKNNLALKYLNPTYQAIEDIMDKFNNKFASLSPEFKGELGVIIDEIINNFITYEKRKNFTISVLFEKKDDLMHILLVNNGVEFDPTKKKDKYIEGYTRDLEEGGLGITLIRKFTSSFTYRREDDKNLLYLTKKL